MTVGALRAREREQARRVSREGRRTGGAGVERACSRPLAAPLQHYGASPAFQSAPQALRRLSGIPRAPLRPCGAPLQHSQSAPPALRRASPAFQSAPPALRRASPALPALPERTPDDRRGAASALARASPPCLAGGTP